MSSHRLSAIQKDTLYVLSLLEAKMGSTPFNIMKLLEIINKARVSPVHPNNFRASIHTLCRHHYLDKYRDTSLNLAVTLTDKGQLKATGIAQKRNCIDV